MVPFWGRCTTHFRTYFSGDWDVHWGYWILTHGHLTTRLFPIGPTPPQTSRAQAPPLVPGDAAVYFALELNFARAPGTVRFFGDLTAALQEAEKHMEATGICGRGGGGR